LATGWPFSSRSLVGEYATAAVGLYDLGYPSLSKSELSFSLMYMTAYH